jgi:hypothetical protein
LTVIAHIASSCSSIEVNGAASLKGHRVLLVKEIACLVVVVRIIGLVAELGLGLVLATCLRRNHTSLLLDKLLRR